MVKFAQIHATLFILDWEHEASLSDSWHTRKRPGRAAIRSTYFINVGKMYFMICFKWSSSEMAEKAGLHKEI